MMSAIGFGEQLPVLASLIRESLLVYLSPIICRFSFPLSKDYKGGAFNFNKINVKGCYQHLHLQSSILNFSVCIILQESTSEKMIDVTVKTLDSQNRRYSVPDDVSAVILFCL